MERVRSLASLLATEHQVLGSTPLYWFIAGLVFSRPKNAVLLSSSSFASGARRSSEEERVRYSQQVVLCTLALHHPFYHTSTVLERV